MSPDVSSEAVADGANALMGSCPIPISDYREIVLAHGSGGKLSQQLIQKLIAPQFSNELLDPLHDGAVFSVNGARLAFSTDSYRESSRARNGKRSRHVRSAPALPVRRIHC